MPGRRGHLESQASGGGRPGDPRPSAAPAAQRCFNCDQTDHFARNCPFPKRRLAGLTQIGVTSSKRVGAVFVGTGEDRTAPVPTPPCKAGDQVMAPPLDFCSITVDHDSSCLIMSGTLNDHPHSFLIDSGVECNILLPEEVARFDLKESAMKVLHLACDGHQQKVEHSVPAVDVQIGSVRALVKFLVAPSSSGQTILGMPWLKAANPRIDWACGTMSAAELLMGKASRRAAVRACKGADLHLLVIRRDDPACEAYQTDQIGFQGSPFFPSRVLITPAIPNLHACTPLCG